MPEPSSGTFHDFQKLNDTLIDTLSTDILTHTAICTTYVHASNFPRLLSHDVLHYLIFSLLRPLSTK